MQTKTNVNILASRLHALRAGHDLMIWVIEPPSHSDSALRAKCAALVLDRNALLDSRQQVIAAEHGVTHTTVQNLTKKARTIIVGLN